MREWRAGGFFAAASLAAGLLNYFFQVIASRQLDAAAFSALNAWFAELSIFLLLSGILNYGSLFSPVPRARARAVIVALNLAALGLFALWWRLEGPLSLARAVVLLLTAYIGAWLAGQVQIRLALGLVAVAGLLTGATKLAATWWPVGTPATLDRYGLALFVCGLPTIWLYSAYLWRAPDAEPRAGKPVWLPVVLLSAATAIVPQFDLVLMHNTQAAEAFERFARASLFYRAIYYMIAILAQWLLPRQVRGQESIWRVGWAPLAAFTLAASLGLTAVSPLVSVHLLHWESAPGAALIFLSCLHMSTLAMLFLGVQRACAEGDARRAGEIVGALGLVAGLQLILRLDMTSYLTAAILIEGAMIVRAWRGRKHV